MNRPFSKSATATPSGRVALICSHEKPEGGTFFAMVAETEDCARVRHHEGEGSNRRTPHEGRVQGPDAGERDRERDRRGDHQRSGAPLPGLAHSSSGRVAEAGGGENDEEPSAEGGDDVRPRGGGDGIRRPGIRLKGRGLADGGRAHTRGRAVGRKPQEGPPKISVVGAGLVGDVVRHPNDAAQAEGNEVFCRLSNTYSLPPLGAEYVLLVLAVNWGRCPLTDLAGRFTDARAENFDIYLPLWVARHNKLIFGILFVAGEAVVLQQWLTLR